jgi:hypothetical protein
MSSPKYPLTLSTEERDRVTFQARSALGYSVLSINGVPAYLSYAEARRLAEALQSWASEEVQPEGKVA